MNYKYNVLWLDDEPIKALEQIREIYSTIYFDKVDYVDVCEKKLESQSEKYHAVILDANGISSDSPEKDANKSGFLHLVHSVIDNHIPLYIYSGQLLRASDGDSADIVSEELHRLGLKDNIFYKSGGPYDLIDKIVKDLDNKYLYYVGHENFLSFFTKGWIPNKYKSEFLDPIMEYYCRKDFNSAHGNHMRNITEQMLERINQEFKLDTNTKKDDPNHYRSIVRAIKFKKLDRSQLISGPLFHMIDLTNAKSHNPVPEDERKLYFESDFSTFFIVANWFYKIMDAMESSQDVIENGQFKFKNTSPVLTSQTTEKCIITTHVNERTGAVVPTYRENGRTYCTLKVEIPKIWKDYEEIKITGVQLNSDPERGVIWKALCQEP